MSHSGMTNVTFHVDTEQAKKTIQLTVSSDTSLSTLLNQTLLPHLPTTPHTLYDLTLSPPKPVTLTEETDGDVGENSVTLYSLGWFPKCILKAVPLGSEVPVSGWDGVWKPESETSETSETNAAQTTKRPKVQEIFKAVEERFTASERLPPSSAGASSSQLPPPPPPSLQIKKSKAERNAALDARIQLLDEKTAGKKGKKKKIADKVKQMLIKSRAEGEKRLRAEDRFYVEVMFLDKSDGGVTNYFFFSRLWSVGRVCDFVDGKVGGKLESDRIEFLIKVNEEFKKIGNIKYLNDLERDGKVKQFERVFVRRVGESEEMTEEME
ncbi:hypothetical protein TrVE_jg5776 [Triparma verrucosa]|uniref:Uncharacterized protein n=1 Tax=Triparma verrucosa TaxID=1606542 RepID=A0A9W7BS12_9STRA|nr:hypothetical protein TrVE_jg5776 [Triparma verrucosa]